ncbi:MAG TPA: hypothetical protein P5152_14680 [Candidatus Paceibacterota bacterium]|nr:hypothetical protein [Candidatus Paceibacterota bacterium]
MRIAFLHTRQIMANPRNTFSCRAARNFCILGTPSVAQPCLSKRSALPEQILYRHVRKLNSGISALQPLAGLSARSRSSSVNEPDVTATSKSNGIVPFQKRGDRLFSVLCQNFVVVNFALHFSSPVSLVDVCIVVRNQTMSRDIFTVP